MLEVRPCRPEELRAGLSPIFHYFGRAPTEEAAENIGRLLPADRLHAAWEDGTVVGAAGAFPFELTVPGGRVRAAGVTLVGVLPTHRRRGVLRSMMRAQLDAVHERGEPVAVLWASEDQIYTRFGYGLASLQGEIDVSRAYSTFHEPLERRGRVRLLDKAEAAEALPPIHERVAAETSGMFARSADWWESRLLSDPDWLRRGRGEMQRALLELDGEPVGYALYRLNLSFEYGSSTGELDVVEGVGTVVAEVRDAFCPWNEGRWRLGPGAERTDAEPELRMDVSALGSVYLGGFTFAELGRAGRLEELASGAVARADELFRVDRAPWCPEIF